MNIWTQVTNSKTYISNTYSILCCYQNMKKMILPLHTEIKHQNLRDRLKDFPSGGEGDDRGWDGWMASPTRWTWVWVDSGSWWWTGRPGVLRFMGLQRVRHDWATELNWTDYKSWRKGRVFRSKRTRFGVGPGVRTVKMMWPFSLDHFALQSKSSEMKSQVRNVG